MNEFKKINIIFDGESSDPDDVLTVCMLSHHPRVNLLAVTVTPGSRHQIGLYKHLLERLELNIPVGSFNSNHPKECVSSFHYNWLGDIPPRNPDGTGADIIQSVLFAYPDTTIVCGGPLKNIGVLLDRPIELHKIIVQGGFAGDNVVPEEYRLEKFKGKTFCPTFNLNGDPKAAIKVLSSDKIKEKVFVSKNVCHGVVYDSVIHQQILPYKNNNLGLKLLVEGMEKYLQKTPSGKAFHDPLAACVAIEPDLCLFKWVVLSRQQGMWGSLESEHPNCLISYALPSRERFIQTIIE